MRVVAWLGSEDGRKGLNFPEPLPLPWDPEPEGTYRGDVMEWDEAMTWLGWTEVA